LMTMVIKYEQQKWFTIRTRFVSIDRSESTQIIEAMTM
jgi:hypothetical protein